MPNPLYSNYLDFAPTFRWGGRDWGQQDAALFRKRMGKRYGRWARNHPTAARVFDPIEQQIYGAYQPELSAIDRERKARQDYYGRLMKNLGGFTAALGPMLSGIPGAIKGSYDQGANTMTYGADSYGNWLNSDMAANAAAGNVTLDAINSPAQLAGGDAGGVLAGAAGWIPSTMMQEQGSAWADRAQNFPKEAALQANLMMRDLLNDAKADDSEFSGKITDVLSGIAGDRVKLQQDRMDQKMDQLKMERDWYLKQQALALSQGRYDLAKEYSRRAEEANTRLNNSSMGLDYQGNPKPGYHYDPKTGRIVKDKTAKTKKGPDWGDIQHDIASEDLTTKGTDPLKPWAGEVDIPMDFRTAYQTLWAKYSGMVKDKKRLRRIIIKILKSKGIVRKLANKPVDSPYQPANTGP